MRKVILFIASSLDGYIARANGGIDWLFSDQNYGYTEFFAGIETVLMGRLTYEQALTFGEYPYKDTQGFVFSRTRGGKRDEYVTFIGSEPGPFIQEMRNGTGNLPAGQAGAIWLVGGSKIIQSCMTHDVIDEYVISIHPVLLGEGIPLFCSPFPQTGLALQNCRTFDTGLVQITYSRRPAPNPADQRARAA